MLIIFLATVIVYPRVADINGTLICPPRLPFAPTSLFPSSSSTFPLLVPSPFPISHFPSPVSRLPCPISCPNANSRLPVSRSLPIPFYLFLPPIFLMAMFPITPCDVSPTSLLPSLRRGFLLPQNVSARGKDSSGFKDSDANSGECFFNFSAFVVAVGHDLE